MQVLSVSEVEDIRNRGMLLSLWDLCSFYVGTRQTATTKRLTSDQRFHLEQLLDDDPRFRGLRRKRVDAVPGYNILQVNIPTELKNALPDLPPKRLGGNPVQCFVKDHNTQFYRLFHVKEGDKRSISDELLEVGEMKNYIDEELELLRADIAAQMDGKSPGNISTVVNSLNRAFDEYTLMNFEEIVESLSSGTTKNLPLEFIERRKEIEDDIFVLEAKLMDIGERCHTSYDPAKDCIDVHIDDIRRFKREGTITKQEMMDKKWCFFDIEVPMFKTGDNTISWVGVTYYEKGETKTEIHTLYDFADEFEGAEVIAYKTEADLVQGIKDSIRREDPYVCSAFNNKFDFIKLRQAGDFGIGDREKEPIHKVTLPFFERIGVKGREVIDLWTWAKIAFSYLPNQKLVTIAKHVLGDDAFEKSISYEEMAELELLAKQGDKEAARKIAHYLIEDAQIMPKLMQSKEFQDALEDAEFMLAEYGIPIANFFHSANSVKIPLDKKFFYDVGSYRDVIWAHWGDMQKREQAARGKFKDLVEGWVRSEVKHGLYKNLVKVYIPAASFLKEHILYKQYIPEAKAFFDRKDDIDDPRRRFMLERYADGFGVHLVTDWMMHDAEERSLVSMLQRHGLEMPEFNHYDGEYRRNLKLESQWGPKHLQNKKLGIRAFIKHLPPHIAQWLDEKQMTEKDFFHLVNKKTGVRKRSGKVNIVYGEQRDRMEADLHIGVMDVERDLKNKGGDIVHKDGRWLYLNVPNGTDFEEIMECNVIPVDRIPIALVAHDFNSKKKGKIFYKSSGAIRGYIEGDDPSFRQCLFERNVLGYFVREVLEGNYEDAIEALFDGIDSIVSGSIKGNDLIWESKEGKCKAYEEGGISIFYEWNLEDLDFDEEEEKHYMEKTIEKKVHRYYVEFNEESGRHYFMEPFKRTEEDCATGKRKKKIKHERRYIMNRDQLVLDLNVYHKKFVKIAKRMLAPMVPGFNEKHLFKEDYFPDFLSDFVQFKN